MNKHLLLFIFLILPILASAQSDSIQVTIIEVDASDQVYQSRKAVTQTEKNYVFANFYLLMRGAFVLGYERALSPYHALSVSVGLTYRDFIYEASNEYNLTNPEITAGTYFSFNYKFYPTKNLHYDDNFYISPGVIRRSYNMTYEIYDGNGLGVPQTSPNVGYNITDLSLKLGIVRNSYWFGGDFIIDIYTGFAYRMVENHNIIYNEVTKTDDITKETKKFPSVYLGAKIGLVL